MYRIRCSIILPDGTVFWHTKRDVTTWDEVKTRLYDIDNDIIERGASLKSLLVTNLPD